MATFQYGIKETDYLKKRDKKLAAVIEKIGKIERKITPDLFTALMSSIISQQISSKAADTVWKRFSDKFQIMTPENIVEASEEEIQKIGMSARKASYIKSVAETIHKGKLNIESLRTMEDTEVIKELSSLRGIGVWTAEMMLIFSLERPNILSFGDLGIKKGMIVIYGIDKVDNITFEKYRQIYSPYCSVASFYLWASAYGNMCE